jgi:hypothetical protein
MGASSSISDNKIYKHMNCGCIYCFDKIDELQLLYVCYDCLQTLKDKKNLQIKNILEKEVNNNSNEFLLNNLEWKNKMEAINYARDNNILLQEFISNDNILKYNF